MESGEIIHGIVEKWDEELNNGEILYIETWHGQETHQRMFFTKEMLISDVNKISAGEIVVFEKTEDLAAKNVVVFHIDAEMEKLQIEEIAIVQTLIEKLQSLMTKKDSPMLFHRGIITKEGFMGEISFVGIWQGHEDIYQALMSDETFAVGSLVTFYREPSELVAESIELLDISTLSREERKKFLDDVSQIEQKMHVHSKEKLVALEGELRGKAFCGQVTSWDGSFGDISYNEGFLAACAKDNCLTDIALNDTVSFELDAEMLNALLVKKVDPEQSQGDADAFQSSKIGKSASGASENELLEDVDYGFEEDNTRRTGAGMMEFTGNKSVNAQTKVTGGGMTEFTGNTQVDSQKEATEPPQKAQEDPFDVMLGGADSDNWLDDFAEENMGRELPLEYQNIDDIADAEIARQSAGGASEKKSKSTFIENSNADPGQMMHRKDIVFTETKDKGAAQSQKKHRDDSKLMLKEMSVADSEIEPDNLDDLTSPPMSPMRGKIQQKKKDTNEKPAQQNYHLAQSVDDLHEEPVPGPPPSGCCIIS